MKRNIEFYKERYDKLLRLMAIEAGTIRSKNVILGDLSHHKTIHNEMWLIECQENVNGDDLFCMYYHESGNMCGFTTFSDDDTFISGCLSFLKSVWGIQVDGFEHIKDQISEIMQ